MAERNYDRPNNRRHFLRGAARYGGTFALASFAGKTQGASLTDWRPKIGLQLTVVRDEMAIDVESTLAKVAAIGYKYVNPVGFRGLDAKTYRAMLDRNGLEAPQIDLGFSTGPDMEKDLEACRVLGIKYAEPDIVGAARRSALSAGAGRAGPNAGFNRGPAPPLQNLDQTKRTAAEYNTYGRAAKKFGMKVIFHNHVEHFELLTGSQSTFFDVFLSETDPELVAMEFDLGFAAIAGRKIPETIRQYPGRFPVWDVRDVFGIGNADSNPIATPNQRRKYTYSVPVGLGEVDFKNIFGSAEIAGLQYFFVLQDNAAAWGDSVAVARVSWQNLMRILA